MYKRYCNMTTYADMLLIIANILNIIYNIPQMVHTYRTKSVDDFDAWFLGLRLLYNVLWVLYGIDVNSMLVVGNSIMTIIASVFIGYYKFISYMERRKARQVIPNNTDDGSVVAD